MENKVLIIRSFINTLKATRIGEDISYYSYNNKHEIITIVFANGDFKGINIAGDSGYAIIKDILKALE